MSKSCLTCPNACTIEEATPVLKKTPDTAMCIKFGHVLSKPGEDRPDADLASYFGESCPEHNSVKVAAPKQVNLEVFLPNPVVFKEINETLPQPREAVLPADTCKLCKFYVSPEVVMAKHGYTAGACAATGRLLLESRLSTEARHCNVKRRAVVPSDDMSTVLMDGMLLQAQYERNFSHGPAVKMSETPLNPLEYETDSPVSESQRAGGVLAWRRIFDPNNEERYVHLPIYRRDYFTEAQQALIPQAGDDEHPEWYADHQGLVYKACVLWMQLDETPALWGEAGTGKTEFFRHMAWCMQVPFRRISITGSTEVEDLAGKMLYSKERGTYFQYGRLANAWREPGVLCIDEPNVGPPDVWQFIRPLTDNSKQLVLDMNEGERILRNDDAYLGMAMNPAWNVLNVGTSQIGDADGSRLMHIFMELPPEKIEKDIIRQRCTGDNFEITEAQLKMVMRVAKELRALCADAVLPITWGIRPQIKVARALKWFEPIEAYRLAAADYLEPETQMQILDVVRAHLVV